MSVLLCGAALVLSVDMLRRREGGIAELPIEEAVRGRRRRRRTGSPTWIATVIGWVLGTLASAVVGGLFEIIPAFLRSA